MSGYDDDAINEDQQAIALGPKYIYPYANLGEVSLLQNHFSEAEKLFLKAIEMGAEDYYEPFNLGLTQALQNNIDDALENWRKSLSLATGTSPQAQLDRCLTQLALATSPAAIADLAATIQQFQSAQELLQEALETAQLLARCPYPAAIDPADCPAASRPPEPILTCL